LFLLSKRLSKTEFPLQVITQTRQTVAEGMTRSGQMPSTSPPCIKMLCNARLT